jgi:hypothetical protein
LRGNRPDGPKIGASSPVARNALAKAAVLEDSRDCRAREIPVPADMQPASQAGCLFVGFDNSVVVVVQSDSAPQHEIVPGFFGLVEPEYE